MCFLDRLKTHLNDLGLIGLASTPYEEATIEGELAKEKAIIFLKEFMRAIFNSDIDFGSPEEMQGMAAIFISSILDAESANVILKSLQTK
ncbi:hypothetical protein D3C71_1920840 [compost metagenome]